MFSFEKKINSLFAGARKYGRSWEIKSDITGCASHLDGNVIVKRYQLSPDGTLRAGYNASQTAGTTSCYEWKLKRINYLQETL